MYVDDMERLQHMLDASRQSQEFVKGKKRVDLDNDPMLHHALVRLIEIIGEAASHITDKFKLKFHEIEWVDIIGMRNRLIHGYFDIDLDIVWDTVTNYIPVLIYQLEKIIESEKNK